MCPPQILEFYAPWCGHCQNLKPAYEKAARNLEGLAQVAAVNCDEDANKQFCGTMGVQGFPTLKIVRPGKKVGKPVIDDYQGPRTATGIVEAVVDRINNHVKRLTDKDVDGFLEGDSPKALLFTEKGTTSALLKSVAIDFLDVIKVGQIRNKETQAVEKFGITKFPTLVLVPGGDKEPIKYDGEIKKKPMVEFLSQAGAPNPVAPSAGSKKKESGSPKSAKSTKSTKSSKPKAEAAPSEEATASADAADTKPDEPVKAQAAPAPALSALATPEELNKECLNEKAHTCVLAFVPEGEDEKAAGVLQSLAEAAHNYAKSQRKLFPIYAVPAANTGAASLKKSLDIGGDIELIAINARRGWWRHYSGGDLSLQAIEAWIDAIRMSEGAKKKLPEGVVAIAIEDNSPGATPEATSEATPDATSSVSSEEATPVTPEASAESSAATEESTSTKGADPTPEAETATERTHEEL